jgi:IclR family pca regulon transcriptional regulator
VFSFSENRLNKVVMDETDAPDIEPADPSDRRDQVESFARGLAVLRAFGPGRRALTLTDIAKITGQQRSTSRRFLLTLCAHGYAVQEGRLFSLTPRVLELGYSYLSSLGFPALIQPHLAGLTRLLGESSSAAVLDGAEIVYIARSAAPQRLMSVTLGVGSRLPAYATSMGQALLGQLSDAQINTYLATITFERFTARTVTNPASLQAKLLDIREHGFAIADQELEVGLRSIAIAVAASGTAPAFAINVATNVARVSRADIEQRILPALRAAAAACRETVQMMP